MNSVNEYVLEHHGIEGQRWGVKNGPPYPLSRSGGWSASEKKQQKARYKDLKKTYKKYGTTKDPKKFLNYVETINGDMIKDYKEFKNDAWNMSVDYHNKIKNGMKPDSAIQKKISNDLNTALREYADVTFYLSKQALGRYSNKKINSPIARNYAELGQFYIQRSKNTDPDFIYKDIIERDKKRFNK